jgi:predicted RNA-binding Zn-ribbon protein involved in translation (DUF1610 family)
VTALVTTNGSGSALQLASSITGIKDQMHAIRQLQKEVMVNGEDYGVIPGTNKPTLLKPGAEKLCQLLNFSTRVEKVIRELPNGHREYDVKVTLHRRNEDGETFGEGVGCCSTMESKYRWRNAQRKCPACGKSTIIRQKEEKGGNWLCVGNDKGGCWAKFPKGSPEIEQQQAGKVENADIADVYNTVLKMAKKRALIDAVLTATAASHLFTQDMEEMAGDDHPGSGHQHHEEPRRTEPQSQVEDAVVIITAAQCKHLVNLSGKTPDWKLAQKTVRQRFKLKRLEDLPSQHFEEAETILRNMTAPSPEPEGDAHEGEPASLLQGDADYPG